MFRGNEQAPLRGREARGVRPQFVAPLRLGRASEPATIQAAPIRARFRAFSDQIQWLEGSARSIGTCTSGVKDANMAVSRKAASRACTPVRIATPAAMWPSPV